MKLGMFMMPLHPIDRDYTQTLAEDRAAIMLADELGFHDAFVGEHITDAAEKVTNSMLFLATLINSTTRIRLGTGTTNLSQIHPAVVAAQAAMFDHLAAGRFVLGISQGALASDAEALGILDEDRNALFREAIDVILEIWRRDPPYDIDLPGNRFRVSTRESMHLDFGVGVIAKPLQQPHPEIVGTVVAPHSQTAAFMGERGFNMLSANFLLPQWVSTHWENYSDAAGRAGHHARREDWRIARTVFVADDDATAYEYGYRNPDSPYRFYYRQIQTKLTRANRHAVFKTHPDQPDEEVTLDFVMDRLCIYGTVNKVVDEILAFRETVGDFGELVYAGMDWVDRDLGRRSMQLMAEEVMPRVNAALASGRRTGEDGNGSSGSAGP